MSGTPVAGDEAATCTTTWPGAAASLTSGAVTHSDAAAALLRLGGLIPAVAGDDWHTVRDSVTALFAQLEQAGAEADERNAIEALRLFLTRYEELREPIEAACARSREVRKSVGDRDPNRRTVVTSPATVGDVLERWPHLDVLGPEPLTAGDGFAVTVHVDAEPPRPGEKAVPALLPDRTVPLSVILVTSRHFVVQGSVLAEIVLGADQEVSTPAAFRLRVADDAEGTGSITAFLAYEGRPSGSVQRDVPVGEPRPAARARVAVDVAEEDEAGGPISADLGARSPDLIVRVMRDKESDTGRYLCVVTTPHLREFAREVPQRWDLPDGASTKAHVFGLMRDFTRKGATRQARQDSLVGAGLSLFESAPENFRRAYWALRDAGKPLVSIYVVSSEPHVPWELMIPTRDGKDDRLPIGVTSAVGRWVSLPHVSPPQTLPLTTSYVVAPTYAGNDHLAFSAEEARYVVDRFSGRRISPARRDTIEAAFAGRGASLFHLICHGYEDETTGRQVIRLDPTEILLDNQIRNMTSLKESLAEHRPLVFLNACKVGRPTPALVGTGGFATHFIHYGARAVIAPIWSVKDGVAAQVARAIYEEVTAHPERPFADVLRDLRRRAYEGPEPEDSWAAYCFYGDPLAAMKDPVGGVR